MKCSKLGEVPDGIGSQGEKGRIEEENDELIRLGRQYFSTDFPNPDRTGCPPSDALWAHVRSGRLPDEALSKHLFACSVCFKEYRIALAQRHSEEEVSYSPWWQSWRRGRGTVLLFKRALTCVGVITLGIFGFWVWSLRRPIQPTPQARLTPVINVSPTLVPSGTSQPEPTASTDSSLAMISAKPKTSSVASPSHLEERSADLIEHISVRAMRAAPEPLSLPNRHLRLKLTLPEGYLAGSYVFALNQGEQTLRTFRAQSADGKKISLLIDLRNLSSGHYLLDISCRGKKEHTIPIVITDTLPVNKELR